jgi:hypothetical protein
MSVRNGARHRSHDAAFLAEETPAIPVPLIPSNREDRQYLIERCQGPIAESFKGIGSDLERVGGLFRSLTL